MSRQIIVGVPSFGSKLKQTRASGYSAINAMLDINDNVLGKATCIKNTFRTNSHTRKCESIIISDNYIHGFDNINENGVRNPFNFGHMRSGHSSDNETSEFGTGLKCAAVVLANVFTIYTRCNDIYIKVQFNFEEMAANMETTQSYEPATFTNISEEEYVANHVNMSGFTTGSTIVLSKLTQLGEDIDVNVIKQELCLTYSGAIESNRLKIHVQKDSSQFDILKPNHDVFKHPTCGERTITHRIHLALDNNNNNIVDIVVERSQNNRSTVYFKWDRLSKKMIVPFEKKIQFHETLDNMQKHNNVCMLTMKSTSTYNTDFVDVNGNAFLFSNKIRVFRDGRRYDDVTFIKADNDGYANHIYNELTYVSKSINPHIGMLFNKKINIHINTGLTQVIGYIQSMLKGKCYLHKSKFENIIIPDIIQLQPNPKRTVKLTNTPAPQLSGVLVQNATLTNTERDILAANPVTTVPEPVLEPVTTVPEQVAMSTANETDNASIVQVLKKSAVSNSNSRENIQSLSLDSKLELQNYLTKMFVPIVKNSSKELTPLLDFHMQCTEVIVELYNRFVK